MTTTLSPRPLNSTRDQLLADLSAWDTEKLRRCLAEQLGLTASGLLQMAIIIHILEERGEDLSALRIGLLHHLRKIANGQILSEVVVKFAGRPSLISLVGNLPIDIQKDLASGGTVALVVYTDGGTRSIRQADPMNLTRQQTAQVFARDHIRTEAEQGLILDQRREVKMTRKPEQTGELRIDYEKKGVWHKRTFIPFNDLDEAVKLLRK